MATSSSTTLQELPIVISLGQWIWGNTPNPNISPEICLEGFPFHLTHDCGMQIVVKLMGISMILGACLNKAPTLVNIVRSQSVAGLPKSSIYGETIIALNATLYGYLQRFPFTAYGENAAIAMQCTMVMVLMWQYSESKSHKERKTILPDVMMNDLSRVNPRLVTTHKEKLVVTCLTVLYLFGVMYLLPSQFYYVLMSSVMPVMIYARGCQIWEAYKIQHTGTQSIATTSISLGGNLGRILTTIKEVGFDRAALSWYLVSACLNFIMFVQYGLYWRNTHAFLNELKQRHRHSN